MLKDGYEFPLWTFKISNRKDGLNYIAELNPIAYSMGRFNQHYKMMEFRSELFDYCRETFGNGGESLPNNPRYYNWIILKYNEDVHGHPLTIAFRKENHWTLFKMRVFE